MLKTEHTILRAARLEDIPSRFAWFNDPEFTRLYLGRSLPTSYEQVESEVKFSLQPLSLTGLMEFAIQTADGNRYIGNTFFRKINWQDRHAEYGIFIGPRELYGVRLGAEITKTMVEYGFRELGFHRIWLTVFAYNHRAARCFEKCGFAKEALFREVVFSGGVFNDVIGMSILEGKT
jgi:RimJ/RimL family protein N-acetyltransferase